MGLFDAIAQIVEEVVETAETAAEAAVSTAQAIVDDATDAASAASAATDQAAKATARALAGTLNAAARSAGQVARQAQELLHETEDRLGREVGDPLGIASRGLAGVAKGMGQFGKNVSNQVKQGVSGWIDDNFKEAGIPLPDTYTLRTLLDLVLEITAVTHENLRERADRLFGDSTNGNAKPGNIARKNPPPRSRLNKGLVIGNVTGPAGQATNRIRLLLDRQSIAQGHCRSQGNKQPVPISLGRQFIRDLFADHLLRVTARSRSQSPTTPRSYPPMTPQEPIIAAGFEMSRKIVALTSRASAMLSSSRTIVKRVTVRGGREKGV